MSAPSRCVAQYIRMSTDRQDLSPHTQKDAIAAFAASHGMEVIRSYEDEGRSGVALTNRPSLRRLLRDVADHPPFADILVYDVSRWGRFQDVDAAAYYEYHCRLNGVQVVYVGEPFANTLTPANVLMKSMKRVMAAEYSRELAEKARAGQGRVIAMGFHMGALPPFGYRRCSVSADRQRRKLLERGERKLALSDRIEWVLGPEREVALVQRICRSYVAGLLLEEIAALVRAEGWRTANGKTVSTGVVKTLLRHEALVGNFVWGDKGNRAKVIATSPSRQDGSVPRIIDDDTWRAVQARLARSRAGQARERQQPRPASSRKPRQLRLALAAPRQTHRRTLGLPQELRDHTRDFGRALSSALQEAGLPAAFDTRTNILTFWGARLRLRLMWPSEPSLWTLPPDRSRSAVQHVLVARMEALCRPLDFFLLPAAVMRDSFPNALQRSAPKTLARYHCRGAEDLVRRLSACAAMPRACCFAATANDLRPGPRPKLDLHQTAMSRAR